MQVVCHGAVSSPATPPVPKRERGVMRAAGVSGRRREPILYVAVFVTQLLLLVRGASGEVTGLSVTSVEETKRCFDAVASLRTEIRTEVRAVKPDDGNSDEFAAEEISREVKNIRSFYMPYTNDYCKARDQQLLELRPEGCLLEPLDPEGFLRMIRGRRLIIWGDSTQRQFFSYFTARLEPFAVGEATVTKKTHYGKIERGGCKDFFDSRDKYKGLRLSESCFKAGIADWNRHCMEYPGNTKICFVRNDKHTVDRGNVVFYNDLRESDIVFANVGLHHNHKPDLASTLLDLSKMLSSQARQGRRHALWLWRDTSPQHFWGENGPNYPEHNGRTLRHVDIKQFRCTKYPYQEMRRYDWRNRVLMEQGVETFARYNLPMPILRIWNLTAMLPAKHPQTLGQTPIADCTHYCPGYGGVYELWSVMFFNFLTAALKHEDELRVPVPPEAADLVWEYPEVELTLRENRGAAGWFTAEEMQGLGNTSDADLLETDDVMDEYVGSSDSARPTPMPTEPSTDDFPTEYTAPEALRRSRLRSRPVRRPFPVHNSEI